MKLMLFTDGSVHTKLRIGCGAYLTCSENDDTKESLVDNIRIKFFEDTSSTKLELQTLLWALSEISTQEIILYTDSQNIVKLPMRREKLEANNYRGKSGNLLNNHHLYREFFAVSDKMEIEVRQIKGHSPSREKNRMDQIFSLVDRASRNALRTYCKNLNPSLAPSRNFPEKNI